jgi:hypothetical protein
VVVALGLLLVVLVAVALVVNYLLGDRMRTDLRQRLADRAGYAQMLSDQGVSGQTLADRLAGQGITATLTTTGGQEYIGREAPAWPGSRPGDRPRPPAARRTTPTVQENGEQLTVQLDLGNAVLTLQTSQAEIDHTLALLSRIELVAGAVTLLVVGLVMIRLVGVALAPLDRMTALAWRIRDGARGRRLRPTRPGTDLGRTATAFDGMLDALEAAEADARSAQDRMRQFLADASHDLRTPLAAIIASAEQVLRTDPDRETRERRLVEVVREARRSSRLVDDLLFMARLDSPVDNSGEPGPQAGRLSRPGRGTDHRAAPAPTGPAGRTRRRRGGADDRGRPGCDHPSARQPAGQCGRSDTRGRARASHGAGR